jgi:hypothetical protein
MSQAEHPVVFTAQSKRYFYCRDAVCEYVLKQDRVPLNPFRVFEYFLGDRVQRDAVRAGNNALIVVSSELWVFGQTIADGVLAEILLARSIDKPVRFFNIDASADKISPIDPSTLEFERPVYARHRGKSARDLRAMVMGRESDKWGRQTVLFSSESDE